MAKPGPSAFVELLGSALQSKQGPVDTATALEGKTAVLLYFSAHWCPPCRRFTPELAAFYEKLHEKKNFEVVFVSSDHDQAGFDEYFGEMPWLALPYDQRDQKQKLSAQYGVRGIPTLVVLDSDGSTITTKGRGKVAEDPEAESFPWKPPTFQEAIGNEFVNKAGEKKDRSAIDGKTIGIYFSASWCPPCKMFTPRLAQFYAEYKKSNPDFEIIFVSSDRDVESFDEYFKTEHGDWLAVPHADRARKGVLSDMFDVEGIPTFVIVGADGQVINKSGRGKIEAGVKAVLAKGWEPPLYCDFSEGAEAAGHDINEKPALVVFMEGYDDGEQDEVKGVVEKLAAEYVAAGKASGSGPDVLFFTNCGQSDVGGRVRELTKLGNPTDDATLVLLDIPDQGGYYTKKVDEVSEAAVREFIAGWKAKSLERKQLGE